MIVLLAFLRRDLHTNFSYRLAFLLQVVSSMFGLLSFFYLSKLVRRDASAELDALHGSYFAFLAIGLALASFVYASLRAGALSLRDEMNWGTLESLLATDAPLVSIILGSALWQLLWAAVNGMALFGAAVWLGGVRPPVSGVPWAFAALLLTITAFLGAGMVVSALTLTLKRGDGLVWLISEGAGLLGGVYYPISVLPSPLRRLAEWAPLTPALRLIRRALLSNGSWRANGADCLLLAGWAVLLVAVGLWSFETAVRGARRNGSLSHV